MCWWLDCVPVTTRGDHKPHPPSQKAHTSTGSEADDVCGNNGKERQQERLCNHLICTMSEPCEMLLAVVFEKSVG